MANQIKKDREQYINSEIEKYSQQSIKKQEYEQELDKLQRRFRKMKKDDPLYEEMQSQTKEMERLVNGAAKRQQELAEHLKGLGADSIVQAKEAEEAARRSIKDIEYTREVVNELTAELELLQMTSTGTEEDLERIEKKQRELDDAKDELEAAQSRQEYQQIKREEEKVTNADIIKKIGEVGGLGVLGVGAAAAFGKERTTAGGKGVEELGTFLGDKFDKLAGPIGKVANIAGRILDVVGAVRKTLNGWVDEAADVLANNVGKINAALEGTGKTYASTTEAMVSSLGMSRFVKQTDYISQIAALTAKGVSFNVEQRAILETIKDKTIASFDATNANLLRLIRIRQQDITANMFGVEAALRNTLNKVFKDSTYLYDLYDQISGAITDALVVSGQRDVSGYSSVVQTWMGAMYESGVEGGLVNKLANAINNLGSGNVSALASDADIQRLILLSMDTIGMDYADILQQGLSTSDINDLLTAIVKYLSRIESNTKDNNVLTSSYTNLFGMTRADLAAIKNLEKKMGSLTAVNAGTALSVTKSEIANLQSTERTIAAEQINNFLANAKFTFGNEIAKDTSSYLVWKISNLVLDVVDSVAAMPGVGKLGGLLTKTVGAAAGLALFGDTFKGLFGLARSLPSVFKSGENGGINNLINGATYYSSNGAATYGDYTSTSASLATSQDFKTVNMMQSIKGGSEYNEAVTSLSGPEWTTEEEKDPAEEILNEVKEMSKTLVKAEADAQHLAVATYLVGMTDDTLRSFASIFADEDSMADTFSGKNNTLKDNMFKYLEDTTSNSKNKSGGKK